MSSMSPESVAVPITNLVATDGKVYPLREAHLQARAEGGYAFSTLVQVFDNPHAEALGVTYRMPLPVDGAVLGYTITVGDRVIRGTIRTREDAKRDFDEAVKTGRVAGLLEEERGATFTQSLGNIPAHTAVKVAIDVLQPLGFLPSDRLGNAASWEYRFPTVLGLRYSGEEGRVADVDRVSSDRSSNGTPARLQLDVTVGSAKSVAGLTSPSHTLITDETGAIHFAQGVALDRDVVIQWHATAQAMGVTAVEGAGLPGDDGRYVLVTVVPPTQPASVFTRELTILLDTSGSMRGDRLDHAKRVVGDLLRSLEPQDAFELLEFNNDLTRHTPGKSRIAASSSAIAQTLAILDTLVAQGGTELHDAIRVALADLSASAQRQIVLLTDGDVNFESEVVGEVAASGNARLHVVAIGAAPNRALTQQAAMAGRGLELLVSDEASAARAAERLVKNTAHPVLTQLTLSGTAVVGKSESPLRDVFAGQPLLIPVEVSAQGGTLILQGLEAGYETPWTWSTELAHVGAASQRTLTSLPLGAILGRVRVAELEVQHALHGVGGHSPQREGQAKTIDQRIEKAALRHRIVSRRTSLVAIAEEPSSDPNQPRRQVEIEVEMPSDVEMFMDELAPSVVSVSADMSMFKRANTSGRGPLGSMEINCQIRRSVDSDLRYGLSTPRPSSIRLPFGPHITARSVVWLDPDRIAIEFEMPDGTFADLNGRRTVKIELRDSHGTTFSIKAKFVTKECSKLSRATSGEVVRVVLRSVSGTFIPESGGQLELTPGDAGPLTLSFTIPSLPSEAGR